MRIQSLIVPRLSFGWHLLALLASACSHAAPSAKTAQTALDAMNDGQRRTSFESTASALDTRPEYVDEFYRVIRKHPASFDRFLANTARDLHEDSLANETAGLVLQHPDSLETLLLVTLDRIHENPAAADALTRAMLERRVLVADLITDTPLRLTPITEALMRAAAKKPAARAALRKSMSDARDPVARIIIEDPDTVGALMKAMLDAGVTRSVIEHSLAELKK
jgi:hypothetical protein